MRLAVACILLLFSVGQAVAEACPDFFRFVDFGIEDSTGVFYPGGSFYRAEGFDGQLLLLTARTQCRAVADILADGHGNPIPVVSSIHYDPEKTGIDLTELRIFLGDDAIAAAESNAEAHLVTLQSAEVKRTQGSQFLCASLDVSDTISCQLVSPYPGNVALVVHCDAVQCTMPVLAIGGQRQVTAAWDVTPAFLDDPDAAGSAIFDKVQQIHAFLAPLSSPVWF